MTLNHRYFVHERAAGSNWLLAGKTFASVWWMAGAGVGTSFVAARMAADFVADPVGVGCSYGTLLANLLRIHETFDWMASASLEDVSAERMRRFCDAFVRTNVIRLAKTAQPHTRRVPRACGRLLEVLVERQMVLKDYCDVVTAPLGAQTRTTFGPEAGTKGAAVAESVVLQLADVISGRLPVDVVDTLLAPQVVSHIDGLTVRGGRTWKTWLAYLRSRPGMADLELVDARVQTEPDGRISLHGRWRASGLSSADPAASARYRVRDGRIAVIWTKSDNYTFILGPMMSRRWGKLVASAKASVWARRFGARQKASPAR